MMNNSTLDNILNRLEKYTDQNQKDRESLQHELLVFANNYPDRFIKLIQQIESTQSSMLFDIYEVLSKQPNKWVDFIVSEFDRIQTATETAKAKFKVSTSYPLTAISFFIRKEFDGNEKLINRIKLGTKSSSTTIVKISLDLLADVFYIDKTKYSSCRQVIENFASSNTTEISRLAKSILSELDNPATKKWKLNFYSTYSYFMFIGGLSLSLITINYYSKTFIDFAVLIATFIITGLIAWFIHSQFTVERNKKKSQDLALGFGYGLLFCFLLLYVNFHFCGTTLKHEKIKIIEHGTLPGGKYSDSDEPYVRFYRSDRIREITFPATNPELVEKADSIDLTTKKGVFGFDIIVEKKLKK